MAFSRPCCWFCFKWTVSLEKLFLKRKQLLWCTPCRSPVRLPRCTRPQSGAHVSHISSSQASTRCVKTLHPWEWRAVQTMDSEWNIQDKFVYVTMNEYNIYIYYTRTQSDRWWCCAGSIECRSFRIIVDEAKLPIKLTRLNANSSLVGVFVVYIVIEFAFLKMGGLWKKESQHIS